MHLDPLDFTRPVPLFPLPNCVLFPGVVQPLHIFEPRYQEMMADTLADQSALAMALLKPGWENDYYGCPPIHELICVGRIVTHEKLDDGKYNLLLHGVTRARVVSQKKSSLYRCAMVEVVPDAPAGKLPPEAGELQRKVLAELFENSALKNLTITQSLQSLFDASVPTPRLIDVLSFTLVQDIVVKQRLLEELDPVKRGELLLRELVTLADNLKPVSPHLHAHISAAAWPPPLSTN